MSFSIIQIHQTRLEDYQQIPIAFEVCSIYDVTDDKQLIERPLSSPYTKDYDAINGKQIWSSMNLTDWGIFLAIDRSADGRPIGGAMVAMPECALWDLRVSPTHRRSGVGRALFQHAIAWIRQHEARRKGRMMIETQNTNVPACRFYASMGAILNDIDRRAYADVETVKDEIRLNWYIDLSGR